MVFCFKVLGRFCLSFWRMVGKAGTEEVAKGDGGGEGGSIKRDRHGGKATGNNLHRRIVWASTSPIFFLITRNLCMTTKQ